MQTMTESDITKAHEQTAADLAALSGGAVEWRPLPADNWYAARADDTAHPTQPAPSAYVWVADGGGHTVEIAGTPRGIGPDGRAALLDAAAWCDATASFLRRAAGV